MVESQPIGDGAEARSVEPGGSEAAAELQPDVDPPRPHSPAPPMPAGDSCVLLTPPAQGDWLGQEHRQGERYLVQASRPIALRLLDADGQPQGRWLLADILDIGRGGLSLLVSGTLELPCDQLLQLDVRCHPDFGQLRLEAAVRWCHSSSAFTTLGLSFLEPRPRMPRLELERRTVRRDPNSEAWAQD